MAIKVAYSLGRPSSFKDLKDGVTLSRAVGNTSSPVVFPEGFISVLIEDPDTTGVYYGAYIEQPGVINPSRIRGTTFGNSSYSGLFRVFAAQTGNVLVRVYRWTTEADRNTFYDTGTMAGSYTQLFYGAINITNVDPVGTTYEIYPPNTGGPVSPTTGTPVGDTAGSGGNTNPGTPIIDTSGNVAVTVAVPVVISTLTASLPQAIETLVLLTGDSSSILGSLGEVVDDRVAKAAEAAQESITSIIQPLVILNEQMSNTKSQLDSIVEFGNTAALSSQLAISTQLGAIENYSANANITIIEGINSIWSNVNAAAVVLGTIASVIGAGSTERTANVLATIGGGANVTPLMEEVTTYVLTERIKTSDDPTSLLGKQAYDIVTSTNAIAVASRTLVQNTIDTMRRSVQATIDDINVSNNIP